MEKISYNCYEDGITMNYRQDMDNCIKYIESHLEEKITMQELADSIHYSLYHFGRVFQACYGMAPMEYVRYRKLLMAMNDLEQGNKITQVGLNYGYETPSGFAKAFRREFGFSPKEYRENRPMLIPRIVEKEDFNIIGLGKKIKLTSPIFKEETAAYWNEYDMNGIEELLYEVVNPPMHGEFGVCVSSSDKQETSENTVVYLLGVLDETNATSMRELERRIQSDHLDVYRIHIPRAKYAVFTTPIKDTSSNNDDQFSAVIRQTWKYIFQLWFQDSDYWYDQSKYDFEYYDERCHYHRNSVMDIYIPVIEKQKKVR